MKNFKNKIDRLYHFISLFLIKDFIVVSVRFAIVKIEPLN